MTNLKVSGHLQNNYDRYYEDGGSEWRRLGAVNKAANIQALCQSLRLSRVIELGAGHGAVLAELANRGFAQEFFALEISPTGVAAIDARNIPGLRQCAIFDGYDVPHGDNSFDLAVLTHVVEHAEYPRRLLYEAKRNARDVDVEVPCEDNVRLPMDFILDEVGHINFYSPKTIRRLLQTCGLEVLHQLTTHPSRAVYQFQKGKKGLFAFYVKQGVLQVAPALATQMFTYNSSLLSKVPG